MHSSDEGNRLLAEVLEMVIGPAARELGIEFTLSPAEVVIPDTTRVSPIEVPGVGMFDPHYSVLFDNETQEPLIQCNELRSESIECQVFGGRKLQFTIN